MSNKTPSLSEAEAKRQLGHHMIAAARRMRETRAKQPAQYASWPDWLKPQASPFVGESK